MKCVYGWAGVLYVITKFSRMDSLPNFVTHGAPLGALRARELRYNLIAPEARALCVNVVRVLASCKLAALSFTCTYPMVSAMTSYSSLTSRRIFVSRQHSTESDFEFLSMTTVFMKSCLFIVCKTMFTIGESQAISHENRTANTRTPNCQSSQGKI